MGVHVFQDDMSYERICLKGGMYWCSACFMMAFLQYVLFLFYWKTFLSG